jgi:signal transduction histidine kinase
MAKILHIDDDPTQLRLVAATLKNIGGHEVVSVSTGLAGIDLAKTCQPDLILVDVNLPDMQGPDVARRLRPLLPQTPIIALTSMDDPQQREMTLVAGTNGFLTKGLPPRQLLLALDTYMNGMSETLSPDRAAVASQTYADEVVARLEGKVRELQAANEELRRLDEMKNAFIQLTAHELRTPLTIVSGYAQLLGSETVNIEAILTSLINSIKRLESIVNEVVLVARLSRAEMDFFPVTASELIAAAIKKYTEALNERQIECELEIPQGVSLRGDAAMLGLVFSNLISNAIKYTPDGSLVVIRVTNGDDEVMFAVEDYGVGIDPDKLENIFEYFYTTGDTQLHSTSKTAFMGGGMGLGLTIAKIIVEQHSGSIWAESQGFDKDTYPGSTVYVKLPKEPVKQDADEE